LAAAVCTEVLDNSWTGSGTVNAGVVEPVWVAELTWINALDW